MKENILENQKHPTKFQCVALNHELIIHVKKLIAQKNREQNKILLAPEYRSVPAFITEAIRQRLLETEKTTTETKED